MLAGGGYLSSLLSCQGEGGARYCTWPDWIFADICTVFNANSQKPICYKYLFAELLFKSVPHYSTEHPNVEIQMIIIIVDSLFTEAKINETTWVMKNIDNFNQNQDLFYQFGGAG